MSNKDPFLLSLGVGNKTTPSVQPDLPTTSLLVESPSDSDAETLVETANDFMEKISGASSPDIDEVDTDIRVVSEPSSSSPSVDLPPGAIGSVDGDPFTDFEAAKYRAQQMSDQTGDHFSVQALASDQFIVIPPSTGSAPRESKSSQDGDQDDDRAYLHIPVNKLKLKDFPKGHPVHKCGLSRYKRYLKKEFKFKPAYRSMWSLLLLVPLGILTFFWPISTLNLLPAEIVASLLEQVPAEKLGQGVSAFGGIMAVIAIVKMFVQRHIKRYMLKPGFANYEEGIIRRKSTKIQYANIVNYDVHQGIVGRLMNYGTLELSSAGSDGHELSMHNILAPRLVEVVLEGKMEEARRASNRY